MYDIELEAVKRDYINRSQLSLRTRNVKTEQKTKQNITKPSAELRAVMTAVTDDNSLFEKMRCEITGDDLQDPNAKMLFSIMEECSASDSFSVNSILNRCPDEDLKKVVLSSLEEYASHPEELARDSMRLLKRQKLKRKQKEFQVLIAQLDKSLLEEDRKKLGEILSEKMNIDRQIALLKE
jgi:DNA primase